MASNRRPADPIHAVPGASVSASNLEFWRRQGSSRIGRESVGRPVDKRRIAITAGNLAVIDIFDNSVFAHDARTQFLNWALLAHGAYDYAADAWPFVGNGNRRLLR
jgi:hypothetical protein